MHYVLIFKLKKGFKHFLSHPKIMMPIAHAILSRHNKNNSKSVRIGCFFQKSVFILFLIKFSSATEFKLICIFRNAGKSD